MRIWIVGVLLFCSGLLNLAQLENHRMAMIKSEKRDAQLRKTAKRFIQQTVATVFNDWTPYFLRPTKKRAFRLIYNPNFTLTPNDSFVQYAIKSLRENEGPGSFTANFIEKEVFEFAKTNAPYDTLAGYMKLCELFYGFTTQSMHCWNPKPLVIPENVNLSYGQNYNAEIYPLIAYDKVTQNHVVYVDEKILPMAYGRIIFQDKRPSRGNHNHTIKVFDPDSNIAAIGFFSYQVK